MPYLIGGEIIGGVDVDAEEIIDGIVVLGSVESLNGFASNVIDQGVSEE